MCGDSIIGVGSYVYKYNSGRTGEWFQFRMSPRKASLTIYVPVYLETIPDITDRLNQLFI